VSDRILGRLAGLLLLAIAGCAAVAPLRQGERLVVHAPDLAHPLTENSPKPSRPEDPVKLGVFHRINADRAAAGLPPVAWDESASRVADAFCSEQVREGTRGHFTESGMPPYARTALAGIFGMGAENSVAWTSTATSFEDPPLSLALSGQADMLAEKPPNDGHRRTMLDPDATHVGVGWAQGGGRFRMSEEFLTRHLESLTLERVAKDPVTILIQGQVLSGWRFAFITVAHETAPRRLTRAQANARWRYSYPTAQIAYVQDGIKSMRVVGTNTQDVVRVGPGGDFAFRFTPGKPGLWTFVFYTADSSGQKKPRPGGAAVLWIERASAQ
jgi:uncharacterized protein YkwD